MVCASYTGEWRHKSSLLPKNAHAWISGLEERTIRNKLEKYSFVEAIDAQNEMLTFRKHTYIDCRKIHIHYKIDSIIII